MDSLAARMQLLELEAELQRASLAVSLDAARRRSPLQWLLPALGSTLESLTPRRLGWLGVLGWLVRLAATRYLLRARAPRVIERTEPRRSGIGLALLLAAGRALIVLLQRWRRS